MIKDTGFMENVIKALKETLGDDCKIKQVMVPGADGSSKTGICVWQDGKQTAPAFYLEKHYQDYLHGNSLKAVIAEICREAENARKILVSKTDLSVFSMIKEHIIFLLVRREGHEEFLEKVPYVSYFDMAVVFVVAQRLDDRGAAFIKISWELMKLWNLSEYELFMLARKNTPRLFPVSLRPMSEVLMEMMPEDMREVMPMTTEEDLLYVLTNGENMCGAAVVLYDSCLEEAAERIGADLIVIPCSINEMLLLPYEAGMDLNRLRQTVYDISRSKVSKNERLSDQVYLYRRSEGHLEVAA